MEEDAPAGRGSRPTFPPYSPDQVHIVETAAEAGGPLECPICSGALDVYPFDMLGQGETAFELQCKSCRHFLVIRDLPEHLR